MQDHLAGDTAMDFGDFTRLAFQIAKDQRHNASSTGFFGRRIQRLLGPCDQLEMAARQALVVRLDRLRTRILKPRADVGRYLDVVTGKDRQGFGRRGRVGHGRAGGDHRSLVARYIGNRIGVNAGRPAGLGQTAALDCREVFAYAIHLADVRAGTQQRLVDRLLVGKADAFGRQRQQGRAAAG